MAPQDFLGQGWSFPVATDASGDIALVAGAEDIRQAVILLLETEPGERVMRPDFGAGLRRMLFEPINQSTIGLIRHRVLQALTTYEPRIDVEDDGVSVFADEAPSG